MPYRPHGIERRHQHQAVVLVRLALQHGEAPNASPNSASALSGEVADYDVRWLLAPDGKWHEFLVLSAWASMQATVCVNDRLWR